MEVRSIKKLLVGTLLIGSLFGCSAQTNVKDVTVRETEFGQVKGIENDGVVAFYGVPYGANPVDEKRWSEAVDPTAWKDVLDCSEPA